MKVLSIKEPFATLIKEKTKQIETRSWKTSYRGELYIHASSAKVSKAFYKERPEVIKLIKNHDYSYGNIICKCKLVDCIKMTSPWIERLKKENPKEYLCGYYEVNRYAWILEEIEILDCPIPVKGRLGIWNFSEQDEKKDKL